MLPTQETYPRYGSYVGFNPLTDPRVMWHNILGPGGVRELLWLERTEGYAEKFLDHQPLNPGDSIVIFGHSGRNASGIDTALYAKKRGLTVVAITAKANLDKPATHSSGKRLADAADIVIDTGAPIEDAIVAIDGWSRPVAGSSTVLAMMMMHELLARTAVKLSAKGVELPVFASPTIAGVTLHDTDLIYGDYKDRMIRAAAEASRLLQGKNARRLTADQMAQALDAATPSSAVRSGRQSQPALRAPVRRCRRLPNSFPLATCGVERRS